MLMIHIKKYYEAVTGEEIATRQYDNLYISPVHIHKNKKYHKDAILTLGNEIVEHIQGSRPAVVKYAGAAPSVAVEH